jgi:hypothetical protein
MKHGRTSIFLLALACPWLAPAGTGYRDDRVSLNGTWRFQLRHDNRLLAAAPVRFGPVTA